MDSKKIKIAISAKENKIESEISEVFGRCQYFVIAEIIDNKIEKTEIIENKTSDQIGGAGLAAAQFMAENNVNAIIAGNVGPRAEDVLRQFKIDIYISQGVIKDALNDFISGKLRKL